MARWLFYYLLVGAGWVVYNLYGVPEVSAKVREKLLYDFRGLPMWARAARVLGAFVSGLAWPFWLAFTLAPTIFPRRFRDALARRFRRDFLDRDGMMEPQMPVPRWSCHVHPREALVDQAEPCSVCGNLFAVIYCRSCVLDQNPHPKLICSACCAAGKGRSNVVVLERMGDVVAPQDARPCPWCGHYVFWVDDEKDVTGVGMRHAEPICDDWKKMQAAEDVNAHLVSTIESAKLRVAALRCLDCSEAVLSAPPLKGITADEERAFEARHTTHRLEARLMDGTRRPIAGGTPKAKESQP